MTPLDRIITAAKQNPEGLLLLGAGIALILRQTTKGSRPSDQGSRNARKKSRSTAGNSVRSTAESVSEYVADAKEKASEYGEAAVNEASRAFKATRKSVGNFAEDQPVGLALGGLAAGILLAAMFPPTKIEQRALGPIGRRAADMAADAKDRIKDVAAAAGEGVKEAAKEGIREATEQLRRDTLS